MVWQYITFQYLLYKKGLLLTVIRTRGLVETRRCGAAEARSQLITWSSALTLCASYMSLPLSPPPPAPAPPLLSQAWSLSPPLLTLTRGTQGCPKIISLDKNTWHPTFEKSFQSSFFLPLGVRTFLQHLLPKMLSLLHHSVTRESFPALSFVAVFSPFLNECQLFMPKDFLEPPCLTLLGVSLVLWERVEGGKQITSALPQFYCPLSPNS